MIYEHFLKLTFFILNASVVVDVRYIYFFLVLISFLLADRLARFEKNRLVNGRGHFNYGNYDKAIQTVIMPGTTNIYKEHIIQPIPVLLW